MSPSRAGWIVLALALSLPGAASAEGRVDLYLRGLVDYDPRLFVEDGKSVGAFSIRLSPMVRVRSDPDSQFVYDVSYRPEYRVFPQQSWADRWNHLGSVRFGYDLSETTRVRVSDQVRLTDQIQFLPGEDVNAGEIQTGLEQSFRNFALLSIEHDFTRRMLGYFSAAHRLDLFERENRFDSSTLIGRGGFSYTLRPVDYVGAGASLTYQATDSLPLVDGSRTIFYQIFGTWHHFFSPSFDARAQLGPALINSRTSATRTFLRYPNTDAGFLSTTGSTLTPLPQPNPQPDPDTTVTFPTPGADDSSFEFTLFAEFEIHKKWRELDASLIYTRSEAPSSGLSASTVGDIVNARLRWDPNQRWFIDLWSSWSRREAVGDSFVAVPTIAASQSPQYLGTDAAGNLGVIAESVGVATTPRDNFQINQVFVGSRITRRLTRSLRAMLFGGYTRQLAGRFGDSTENGRWVVSATVQYDFAPVRF